MAKILDKLLPNASNRLVSLRQNLDWGKRELESLAEKYATIRREKCDAFIARANRRLAKSAFLACDKEAYIDALLAEKLAKYDIRVYIRHRAVGHGTATRIFRAIKEGKNWETELVRHKSERAELAKRRLVYQEKLARERAAFLAKHTITDPAPYETLLAIITEEYRVFCENLDRELEEKWLKEEKILVEKLQKLSQQIEEQQAKITLAHTLPEDVLLEVNGLCMYFGGLKAVDNLSFTVKKGEIFGLIGPNGAGKTTVFNCITRFYDATAGDIYFENKYGEVVDMRDFAVHDVILQGIGRTFQNIELVKEISVIQNLLVAATRTYRSGFLTEALGLPLLKKEEKLLLAKAKRILAFMGLDGYSDWLAMGLPYGILKKVEIARALMADAKLIIMDEPAAGLNDTETAELTETIRKIRDEFGVTILLVEHDMGLVMSVCDTVCAISFGQMLAIGSTEEIKQNKAVQEAYLGVEEENT